MTSDQNIKWTEQIRGHLSEAQGDSSKEEGKTQIAPRFMCAEQSNEGSKVVEGDTQRDVFPLKKKTIFR